MMGLLKEYAAGMFHQTDVLGAACPFQNLDKTTVLQETRTFNETPVNPKKCTHILTKILFLINQGEQLGTKEATDAFFAMTKLFQSKDIILRRMVYLGIKELSPLAEDVIIVTSSLTKDMTGKEDTYRAPSIRALCSITDPTMLQAIERYMKQAIVDKNASVSSAALVSSLHMAKTAGDIVKRWVNEVQEALNSDNIMVQYHALGLLYHIRKADRLAVTKLVAKLTKMTMKSPYATCLLIRITCKLMEEENDNRLFYFVESCLRHKSEMVVYEAAHAIVNLSKTTARELAPAICVLQLFCGSLKATLRFAAVRTLNKVAMTHPSAITACNMDLENLIGDTNRSIATLAITTLLKTGAESSVERLMKQISSFVNEISDEFKIVVVQAIRALCEKFPRKHSTMMNFLSNMLRDEGGLDYKAAIADTIITIIEVNPEAKDTGLAHLCEFIEDCEHISLAVRILHLLGKEGPKSQQPARYIRFIYNRVILESTIVRAAAVCALAQFGAACPDLLPNIQVLLARCQMDFDDEVRDRAAYYYSILETGDQHLNNYYVVEPLQVSVPMLEKSLMNYLEEDHLEPFNLKLVPHQTIPIAEMNHKGMQDIVIPASPCVQKRDDKVVDLLETVPQLAEIPGPLFKVNEPVELTELETEYVVKCVKFCYPDHIIFQFECKNTLSDQLLENVRVILEGPEGYEGIREVACEKIPYNETGCMYVALKFPKDAVNCVGNFGACMKFVVKDCDPLTGLPDSDEGYDDEYTLEDVEVTLSDQISRLSKGNFESAWEEADGKYAEVEETYSLMEMGSLENAVENIVSFLGMQPADRSDKVIQGKSSHTLYLAGTFRDGNEVLVRAKLALGEGVTMQLTVRCPEESIGMLISQTVG